MKKSLLTLVILTTTATATEIVHKFANPSFSGINQSAHYLTIDEQERTRKEKIRADAMKKVAELDDVDDRTRSFKLIDFMSEAIKEQMNNGNTRRDTE